MAGSPKEFFEKQQPAAVLKHGILRRYLRPFASKTGRYAPDNRVVYLDGYAGPGAYNDGTPGSPALAAETANAIASFRSLHGIYVEKDTDMYHRLCMTLDDYDNWTAYNDSIGSCLAEVMDEVGQAPLFAFMDPFGLPIPFDDLVKHLLERDDKTEVLINFSTVGLRRSAGHLTSEKEFASKEGVIRTVDNRLGGTWWQETWLQNGEDEREEQVLTGYVRRLAEAGEGGWGSWTIPVARRPGGKALYHLVFMTRHQDGLWQFMQALSGALEDYHDFCHRDELDLDPLEEREKRWIAEIESNIAELLKAGSFVIGRRVDVVCGEALGYAREKHIRRAVKSLHSQGITTTNGVGSLQRMRIEPA